MTFTTDRLMFYQKNLVIFNKQTAYPGTVPCLSRLKGHYWLVLTFKIIVRYFWNKDQSQNKNLKVKMKYFVSAVLVFVCLISWAQGGDSEPLTGPKILFAENSFDFGDITQGDKVEHVFEFENVGNEALIISDVRTTCGCTAPEWPRETCSTWSKKNP